ncbi:hypothetical protein QQF64_013890 [Cirrhinus molitorella]|uniref:Anterior gradient protein 2 homolog n=1 Tax=Cirrhinus molitorella TaxID=172907 RepID=A0ABR3LSG7_9TELE
MFASVTAQSYLLSPTVRLPHQDLNFTSLFSILHIWKAVSKRETRSLSLNTLSRETKEQLVKMLKGILSVLLVLVTLSSAMGKPDKTTPKKEKRIPQTLSRGWGDQLIWAQTYEEALFWSRSKNKPLMVIFHLEDCPHSLALKKAFAEDKEIQKLVDEEFVILNLVYETTDKHLSPDGQYVPRILFVDPSMTVRADITGRYANRMYAYEPGDMKLLLSNMQRAMKFLKTEL